MNPVGTLAWIQSHRAAYEATAQTVMGDVLDEHHTRLAEAAVLVAPHQNTYIIELLEQILLAVSKA